MTREQLALAHHRFYCHAKDPECSEVDDGDYDFADFALPLIGAPNSGASEDDRDALTDTIQAAMCGTVNRDNMTERTDCEGITDAVMALIGGGTAADSRGVHEAAASLQTAEDIATIIEEYAGDLEPPITRDWLVTREWGKDLLHELAARARETGGSQ